MESDARGKPRVSYTEEVKIRCENWNQFQTEYAENLSEGGIFVNMNPPLSPGTEFLLNIQVAEQVIHARAVVVWTKEFGMEDHRRSGMGARFLEIDKDSKMFLKKFVAENSATD